MKTRQKGGKFERYLLDRLKTEVDVSTVKNMMSGAGQDKGDLRLPNHDITIEAKNAKQLNLMHWWKQAKEETYYDDRTILAMRNPAKPEFQETFVLMDLDTFIELLQEKSGASEVINTLESKDKIKVQNLVQTAKDVLKIFEKYE